MALHIDITSILAVAIIVVISVLLLLLLIARHRRRSEYQIAKVLKPLTRAETKNIIIPDGLGGMLEIEHLLLLDQGLLLLEIYPINGHLFGAENIDQWAQIVKGRSYKFANPLRRIRTSRQALMLLAPNVPIHYRVIFSEEASFPKGKPEQVSVLGSLPEDMKKIASSPLIVGPSQQAWDRIIRVARKADKRSEVGEEI